MHFYLTYHFSHKLLSLVNADNQLIISRFFHLKYLGKKKKKHEQKIKRWAIMPGTKVATSAIILCPICITNLNIIKKDSCKCNIIQYTNDRYKYINCNYYDTIIIYCNSHRIYRIHRISYIHCVHICHLQLAGTEAMLNPLLGLNLVK